MYDQLQRRLKRESQALDNQQLKQQLRQQLKDQQEQERQRTARATAEALTKAAKASKAIKTSKKKVQSIVCCPAAMLEHLPMLGMKSYYAHAWRPFEIPGDRHRDTRQGRSSPTARSKPKCYAALVYLAGQSLPAYWSRSRRESPKQAVEPAEEKTAVAAAGAASCLGDVRYFNLLSLMKYYSLQGQLKAASRRGRKPAVSHEQAAEMAEEEGARQQQLQKALQLALRLEDALSTCKANVVRHRARILNQCCLQRRVIISMDAYRLPGRKATSMLPLQLQGRVASS